MRAHTNTVHGMVEQTAARQPAGDAAVFPDDRVDYPGLVRETNRASMRLCALGVRAGDCVGLMMAASISQVSLLLGAMRLGAMPVPLNGRMKASELEFLVHHSGMRVLLCDGVARTLAAQVALGECRAIGVRPDGDFDVDLPAVDATEVKRLAAAVAPEDPSIVLYTSGTTSKPKGVVHTHVSLVAEGRNIAQRLGMVAEDRFWSPLPMFHCGGIVTMLGAFAAGAAFCHVGTFEPGAALDQLERERCTLAFPAFETIWLAILDHPRFPQADLSPLRTVINVGVRERLRAMQERLSTTTQISSFGLTESCGFMCMGLAGDPLEARISTSGRPLPGMELRAVDPETGRDARPGEIGEALFRGVSRILHYHRDPDYTAQTIDPDGWFHSGDLIRIDEEGRISFVGRLKDMLKVGGENVSAAEVEDHLATHPAVKIVQVVAAPDARLGEVACAFVELRDGGMATERELIDHCLGAISTFKVPRYVRFVPEWPMSGTKIQKFRLREMIATELQAAGITEAPKLRSAAAA
jgi:fatty-acyl-CoA synthase